MVRNRLKQAPRKKQVRKRSVVSVLALFFMGGTTFPNYLFFMTSKRDTRTMTLVKIEFLCNYQAEVKFLADHCYRVHNSGEKGVTDYFVIHIENLSSGKLKSEILQRPFPVFDDQPDFPKYRLVSLEKKTFKRICF